jgi:DNA polymerase III subunit delta'
MTAPEGEKPDAAWSLIGHSWAVDHLKSHIIGGQIRHAYLFTGPEGIGRRTLALRFAQALICSRPPTPGEYCGSCRECRQAARMEHPDLSIVAPDGSSQSIKVEQIRQLQRGLHLAPYQARYRLALLLKFERANPNASNALLKTLEEPPPQVILLITASDPEILLPTVVSRCEIIRLQLIPEDRLEIDLQEKWGYDPDQARLLAHLSGGRPGYARQLAADPDLLARRQTWLEDHSRLLGANRLRRFAYAEALAQTETPVKDTLQTWLTLWRDVLLRAAGSQNPLTNIDRLTEIDDLAAILGVPGAMRAIESLDQTLSLLDKNANRRLALEVLMLDLPRT